MKFGKFADLLESGRIPKEGWSDAEIQLFLHHMSLLDASTADPEACGVGEREGRVLSNLVRARCLGGFFHGIGRSGSLCDGQPKAAGSTAIQLLTNRLVRHLMELAGT